MGGVASLAAASALAKERAFPDVFFDWDDQVDDDDDGDDDGELPNLESCVLKYWCGHFVHEINVLAPCIERLYTVSVSASSCASWCACSSRCKCSVPRSDQPHCGTCMWGHTHQATLAALQITGV